MNPLITILARGNSKGLPGKHLKMLQQKPLMTWTLSQAIAWKKADIAISTDSDEIYNSIYIYPCHVYRFKRPAELAQDDTPKLDAIRWTHRQMEMTQGIEYDPIIDLDVTNPLRKPDDIQKAYTQYQNEPCFNLISVTEARRNPYFNQVERKEYVLREAQAKRHYTKLPGITPPAFYSRQQAPSVYDLNNSIYIYNKQWLKTDHLHPICDDTALYVMEPWQAFDIDTELDFQIVEFLMGRYMLNG